MDSEECENAGDPPHAVEVGLTLIELLIVVAVLGILAAVVVFALGGTSAQSAAAACNANAKKVEIAIGAYNAETGGSPTVTADALTSGTNPILRSFPSPSPLYTISIVNGVLMVAAPSTATASPWETTDTCGNTGSSTTTTTTPPSSTTTTASPPTTTTSTTSPPPTTTTTTIAANPSNGVTVTPTSSSDSSDGGQETLTVANSSSITDLTVTINVVKTKGVTHDSQANSFPSGVLKQSSKTSNGVIVYTSTLKSGQIIPQSFDGTVSAVFDGKGTVHEMSGDTWSVTSTSGGVVSTLTGTF
ncbi:MAG TPA: type II secretion system protein [Acidimicrobiales bacterium]|nr:type II secretion system protein [Acidimicrobiales bacterium]